VSCDPERVTGYVDGALDGPGQEEIEAHVAACEHCREQAEAERSLRVRLRALAVVEVPPELDDAVRQRLRESADADAPSPAAALPRPKPRRSHGMGALLPLAAALALVVFWTRSSPPVVSWVLARDHVRCFSQSKVPAAVWSSDPLFVMGWFEAKGSRLPLVPASVGGMELVGGRLCPLLNGSRAAHLYYVGRDQRLSVFVVGQGVRFDRSYSSTPAGRVVQLLRVAGTTVGLVSESREAVSAFREAFTTSVAQGGPPDP
jgi:anti-sigma factor RsiW